MERWASLLSKESRTKQETIPLFWPVVATSVWNFELNSHVTLRSEHARTNTNTHIHTPKFTDSGGNARHASVSRDMKPAVDVMRSDRGID